VPLLGSSPTTQRTSLVKRLARFAVIVLAIASALETVAGIGAAVIIVGEAIKLWDLL
jgi:hypothetical protein